LQKRRVCTDLSTFLYRVSYQCLEFLGRRIFLQFLRIISKDCKNCTQMGYFQGCSSFGPSQICGEALTHKILVDTSPAPASNRHVSQVTVNVSQGHVWKEFINGATLQISPPVLLLDSPACSGCYHAAHIACWTIQQQHWSINFIRIASYQQQSFHIPVIKQEAQLNARGGRPYCPPSHISTITRYVFERSTRSVDKRSSYLQELVWQPSWQLDNWLIG